MTRTGSIMVHKSETNKFAMEDLWIGVDIPDDPKTLKIKKIRDRIVFRDENKRKLIQNGFISNVKFNRGKSEVSISCEILSILSGLFRESSDSTISTYSNNEPVSTDSYNEHVSTNSYNEHLSTNYCKEHSLNNETTSNTYLNRLSNEHPLNPTYKQDLLDTIPLILNHLKGLVYPFTRHDISILRSLKNIILNLQYDLNSQKIQFFVDLLLLHKDAPSVYALKNEIISLFVGIIQYKDIRSIISTKKVIYILNNPNLNSINLLNLVISPSNYQWIKLGHVFNRKVFRDSFGLIVKWYLFGDGKAYKPVIDFFTRYIFLERSCLFYFGQVVSENIEAQLYAAEKGLLNQICAQEINEEVVYAITNLSDTFESNRKFVAESKALPRIFTIFKSKCIRKEYDGLFLRVLEFFRIMTRSVLFLRTHLLEYPIIELLFDCLNNANCGNEMNMRIKQTNCSCINTTAYYDHENTTTNYDYNHQTAVDYKPPTTSFDHEDTTAFDYKPPTTSFDYKLPTTVDHEITINHICSILTLLVNLVLEYGNYKKKIVENKGLEQILKHKETHPIEVLMILKNFLYDTHWQAKEQFLSSTTPDFLNYFFELYEKTKNLLILENLFNLIRNLVCDDSLELILVSYTDLVPQVFKYLEQFSIHHNERVLIQIFYTIANLSANSPAFRDLVFEKGRINFLKKSCNTRDLQLAFVWIIINVSWKDEGYGQRVEKLKKNGIKEFLLQMTTGDSVLLDKINTALENIK